MQELKGLIKRFAPLRRMGVRKRLRAGTKGQSNEGRILRELASREHAPKTFVEFGFHVAEFNCAELVHDFDGLLIDGDLNQVEDARIFLPKNIRVEHRFLTLENLTFIGDVFPKIGILSIDVDGNDYWFLEALIRLEPTIICIEYNASFGLEPVTTLYDPNFNRSDKHPSGWYHGASLTAMEKLANRNGYRLAAIASGGGNAFFTRSGTLSAKDNWQPTELRDRFSGKTAAEQWDVVKDCEFVRV